MGNRWPEARQNAVRYREDIQGDREEHVIRRLFAVAHAEGREQPDLCVAQPLKSFDEFDFVDRYRALGGLRLAIDVGDGVEIRQWDKDTPEAEDFWVRSWAALDRIGCDDRAIATQRSKGER